ncbi:MULTISPECIES: N-acetylglucosamine-6-phosphate deacetylase [unclassified Mucilaginibacter]|uniref:N-acetylglucosamine-6-phosphate deacetylase n=1 Tax=unclassified Mucilaginibacter TaxID=2617802 RepID=UPI002AC95795|nr:MULTISPECIES: N-acetylglucosamine-6-phosphate deacetylase [unclassified Mucilaginibacter]MEB0248709.1 N-acetylglucosamine-6-phosphate deacetylase [Mucilaginibacter sp. 5B2]MEB0260424.1 N-acetylglucosamine-6-phosphate deacetylase [Mucilaginibacter sp. 10I4]MEB0280005.1 N-acetylglucosamine-6-phosphate deacetylase [Mucilaginibacter sp. 10B2]MEB0302694.1 N-acetylglucosamine-6-phosphate deacetylase [Mucilaginibacter sp. 5C4]WPX23653.1 N-acetylglucosamine-6-phosphate deacetylase [Mucilaginibacter
MITALHNLKLISGGTIAKGKAILIKGSHINAIIDETSIPADAEKKDLNGAYLAPGFIDLQIYGSGGKLFAGKPEVSALKRMEDDLLNQGTTGFFATIGTNTNEIVEAGIAAAKEYRANARGNFWGVHLEGPYLNVAKKGAHPAELIKKATLAEVKSWVEQADGVITMITIAPELQDQDVIDYLHAQGIIISSGHSNATYEQGKGFLNKPIPAVTHLFNAMPQMHHREPGYIPAIFEEKPYTSIVADGNHVDWPMIRLAKRELGDKLFLITDAVTAATEGAYQHRLEGNKYVMPDGTLSGSSLTMLKAVQNCVEHVGIELAEAVNMATLYPAELAGKKEKGRVEAGFDADLIIFNDQYQTVATILQGNYLTPTT